MTRRKPEELGELLSAYLDNEVTAKERAEVEALLAKDKEARAILEALQQAADAAKGLPVESAPAGILDAVTARLERETLLGGMDTEVTLARHRRPPLRTTLAFAAMLAIAIGGGFYVSMQLSEPVDQATQLAMHDETQPRPRMLSMKDLTPEASPLNVPGAAGQPSRGFAEEMAMSSLEYNADAETIVGELEDSTGIELYAGARLQQADDLAGASSESSDVISQTTQDMMAEMSRAFGGGKEGATVADAEHANTEAKRGQMRDSATSTRQAGRSDRDYALGIEPAAKEHVELRRQITTDSVTFEQQLRAGTEPTTLQSHAFSAEPLRLTVVSTNAFQQSLNAERLTTLLADRGAAPLGPADTSDELGERAVRHRSLVSRALHEATPPQQQQFYFEGTPGVNYAAEQSADRRILARIPAALLPEVVDQIDDSAGETISIRLGSLAANGKTASRAIAEQVVDRPTKTPTDSDAQSEADLAGWLDRFAKLVQAPAPTAREHAETVATLGESVAVTSSNSVSTTALSDTAEFRDEGMANSDGVIVIAAPAGRGTTPTSPLGKIGNTPDASTVSVAIGGGNIVDRIGPGEQLVTLVIELRVADAPASP